MIQDNLERNAAATGNKFNRIEPNTGDRRGGAHRNPPGLIVVCGATATGKTSLAIALAQRLGSIVISADSRLVYRGFDIGTAKPTQAERQGVAHYAIDICDPRETLTVADYQAQVRELIAQQHAQQHAQQNTNHSQNQPQRHPCSGWPILAGGTGLYIKSIVRGMKIPRVAPNDDLRDQLAQLGQHQCYALLQQVDRAATHKIHANDIHRTLRALEVFYVTGRSLTSQQGEAPPHYPIVQIGLSCDRDRLNRRIQQRTAQMVAAGFVDEVRSLCATYGETLPLLDTLGYAEFRQYLAGEMDRETAIELTAIHTRQFAKRQRTWFQKDPSIHWIDADADDRLDQALTILADYEE
jgi:tRNA dimethylallyltransferase